MMLILFGLPGAGKTYIGKLLEKEFGFFFYDGDIDLTEEMKQAITTKTPFTDQMRDVYFNTLLQTVSRLHVKHQKLVLAQTFIKETYRKIFLKSFPHVQFVLIAVKTSVREKRLKKRKELPLDISYTRQMVQNFEKPIISHIVVANNQDGEVHLKKQLSVLLTN
ncbi:MAG TPA: AAA family ATPase [Patescibacteria group bacterium]|nr:AAA family ATPase [Patescibacteria group bacterium]